MMAIKKLEPIIDHDKLIFKGGTNLYSSTKIQLNNLNNSDNILPFSKKQVLVGKTLKFPNYVQGNVQKQSQNSEKRFMPKRATYLVSPNAIETEVNKTNSETKKETSKRKAKKSVLTLPTAPVLISQESVKSDINVPVNMNRDDRNRKKIIKQTNVNDRKKEKTSDAGYYSKATSYCSTLDIYGSSSDFVKYLEGDKKTSKAKAKTVKTKTNDNDLQDVWSMIRSINKIKYRPVLSDDSILTVKKKSSSIASKNCNSVIKSCHTEEVAYIETFNIDSPTRTPSTTVAKCSLSSSQITVINNTNESVRSHIKNPIVCNEDKKTAVNIDQLVGDKRKKEAKATKEKEYNLYGNKNAAITNKNYTGFNNLNTIKRKNVYHKESRDLYLYRKSESLISEGSSKAQIKSPAKSLRPSRRLNAEPDKKRTFPKITSVYSKENANYIIPLRVNGEGYAKDFNNCTIFRESKSRNSSPLSKTAKPKITRADIRRQLAHIRFPVVVLKKDEVSSNFEKANEEAPQFSGLEEKIWPFMGEWYKKHRNTGNKNEINLSLRNKHKTLDVKKKQTIETEKFQSIKSFCQLKDKVIRMICKKPPAKQFTEEDGEPNQHSKWNKIKGIMQVNDNALKKKDDNTETSFSEEILSSVSNETQTQEFETKSMRPKINPHQTKSGRKWTTDFIENVIRKIKNGVYYNPYRYNTQPASHIADKAECQTLQTCKSKLLCKQTEGKRKLDLETKKDIIPDAIDKILCVDNVLSTIVVETVSRYEIEIKHCDSNVTVQFDIVESPYEEKKGIDNNKSSIPLAIMDGKKVYKSKTTIINDMLPAEICAIVPEMMRHILNGGNYSESFESMFTKTPNSSKTAISNTNTTLFKNVEPYHIKKEAKPKHFIISGGHFGNRDYFNGIHQKTAVEYNPKLVELLLEPPKLLGILSKKVILIPILTVMHRNSSQLSLKRVNKPIAEVSSCISLQLYVDEPSKRKQYLYSEHDLKKWVPKMMNKFILGLTARHNTDISTKQVKQVKCYYNQFTSMLSVGIKLENGNNNEIISIQLPKVICFEKIDNNNCDSTQNVCIISNAKRAIHFENLLMSKSRHIYQPKDMKLFRKMPLYFNIRHITDFTKKTDNKVRKIKLKIENDSRTSLNEITNLEDFFKAAGLNRILSNIFDDLSEKKILSCLVQMKSWVHKISTSQGLLVLLLMNEKETPNLVRFRSLLLHAIATDRITKCSELHKEIEVIERHDFQEGNPYLPACFKSSFNLFEELFWIAKTTASDSNRTLDESAAHHLRHLVERSKQNPSYLRVMARYIGLGLLKSPERKV